MGRFLVWLLLKSSYPHCNLFSCLQRINGSWGQSPQKIFGATPFQTKEKTLSDIKRTLQKGHFHFLAEKGRGPHP